MSLVTSAVSVLLCVAIATMIVVLQREAFGEPPPGHSPVQQPQPQPAQQVRAITYVPRQVSPQMSGANVHQVANDSNRQCSVAEWSNCKKKGFDIYSTMNIKNSKNTTDRYSRLTLDADTADIRLNTQQLDHAANYNTQLVHDIDLGATKCVTTKTTPCVTTSSVHPNLKVPTQDAPCAATPTLLGILQTNIDNNQAKIEQIELDLNLIKAEEDDLSSSADKLRAEDDALTTYSLATVEKTRLKRQYALDAATF